MFTGSTVSVAVCFSHGRVHLPGWRVSRSSRGGTPANMTAEAAPCSSTHFLITDRASCLCTSWRRGFLLFLSSLIWNVTVTVTASYWQPDSYPEISQISRCFLPKPLNAWGNTGCAKWCISTEDQVWMPRCYTVRDPDKLHHEPISKFGF